MWPTARNPGDGEALDAKLVGQRRDIARPISEGSAGLGVRAAKAWPVGDQHAHATQGRVMQDQAFQA